MEELAVRLKKGDAEAFSEFVGQYEKNVYNVALRVLKNAQDAEDAAQEVFLRVYRNIRKFEGKSSLSTWTYQITMNVCVDMTRKRKRHAESPLVQEIGGEEVGVDIPDDSYQPEQIYERKEVRETVRGAIDSLPQDQREVIVLRELTGLSYAELSSVLNVTEGTVKSRLYRARERLANILRENGNKSARKTSDTVKER